MRMDVVTETLHADAKSSHMVLVTASGPARWMAEKLPDHGFRVTVSADPNEAREIGVSGDADVALVQVEPEDRDRLTLVDQLSGKLGVIVVSGAPAELGKRARIQALQAGADDVVPEQFSHEELLWRIRALVRHRPARRDRLTVRDLEIDLGAHKARLEGRPVGATRIELKLLVALAREPRRVHTREELIEKIWGPGDQGFSMKRNLDSHASRLRGKLATDGEPYIVVVRGVGYRLY